MNELMAFNAALALAEKLLPILAERLQAGTITPAQQQEARDRYQALRDAGDAAFAGPAWRVE